MTRPARVTIDLAALQHNFSRVRELARGCKIMAVVKADAYGHGLCRVAQHLNDAEAFGVSCLEEAEQLRQSGIEQDIVLLEGPFSSAELDLIASLNLQIVIHNRFQIEMLERSKLSRPLQVWLKLDSGMHRLGFNREEFQHAYGTLEKCQSVNTEITLMTHLGTANEVGNPMTGEQISLFTDVCREMPGDRSIANSAAIVDKPESHADWVRPGLMLYGVSPMQERRGSEHDLRPVMSLSSQLIAVKELKKESPWVTEPAGAARPIPPLVSSLQDMGMVSHAMPNRVRRH